MKFSLFFILLLPAFCFSVCMERYVCEVYFLNNVHVNLNKLKEFRGVLNTSDGVIYRSSINPKFVVYLRNNSLQLISIAAFPNSSIKIDVANTPWNTVMYNEMQMLISKGLLVGISPKDAYFISNRARGGSRIIVKEGSITTENLECLHFEGLKPPIESLQFKSTKKARNSTGIVILQFFLFFFLGIMLGSLILSITAKRK